MRSASLFIDKTHCVHSVHFSNTVSGQTSIRIQNLTEKWHGLKIKSTPQAAWVTQTRRSVNTYTFTVICRRYPSGVIRLHCVWLNSREQEASPPLASTIVVFTHRDWIRVRKHAQQFRLYFLIVCSSILAHVTHSFLSRSRSRSLRRESELQCAYMQFEINYTNYREWWGWQRREKNVVVTLRRHQRAALTRSSCTHCILNDLFQNLTEVFPHVLQHRYVAKPFLTKSVCDTVSLYVPFWPGRWWTVGINWNKHRKNMEPQHNKGVGVGGLKP